MDSLTKAAMRFLRNRKRAYQQALGTPGAVQVLEDLARFCRANESTGHLDAYMAARLDGRREVWLRIQQHLQLTDEELWRLYDGRTKKSPDGGPG